MHYKSTALLVSLYTLYNLVTKWSYKENSTRLKLEYNKFKVADFPMDFKHNTNTLIYFKSTVTDKCPLILC